MIDITKHTQNGKITLADKKHLLQHFTFVRDTSADNILNIKLELKEEQQRHSDAIAMIDIISDLEVV